MIWLFLSIVFMLGQDTWILNTSKDGHFQILSPGEMKEHIITSNPSIGEIKYHTFTYQDFDSTGYSTIYMVSYYDYPVDFELQDSFELKKALLDVTIEEATTSVNGTIVYEQDDYSYSYYGKFWRINYKNDDAFIKTKSFFYYNRYYSIQVVGSVKHTDGISERKFFNSFQLILCRSIIDMSKIRSGKCLSTQEVYLLINRAYATTRSILAIGIRSDTVFCQIII